MYTGTGVLEDVTADKGGIYLASGGIIRNVTQRNGALVILRGENPYASGAVVSGGTIYFQNGAKGENIVVNGGGMNIHDDGYAAVIKGSGARVSGADLVAGTINVSAGGKLFDLCASGGTVNVTSTANYSGAVLSGATFTGGTLNVNAGAVAAKVAVDGNAAVVVYGTLNDLNAKVGARINFVENKTAATFKGGSTNIAEGTLFFNGTAVAGHATNGVLEGLNADNATLGYKLSIGSGIVLKDAVGNNAAVRVSAFDGAVVSGMTLRGGAIICVNGAQTRVYDTTLTGEAATCNLNLSGGAQASGTVVQAGAKIQIYDQSVVIDDTTIMAGGSMVINAAADTGANLMLDFTGTTGNQSVYITNLGNISDTTTVYVKGAEQAAGTYTLGNAGTLDTVTRKWGLYENALANGGTYDDALNGLTYAFNGTAVTATALSIKTVAAAGLAGDNYTELRTADRAAKWTGAADNATLVTESFAGDAWLTVAGNVEKALYGAGVDYEGTVNINAKSGTIRNLAAGAEAGKTVGAVKLTFDGATLDGAGYAGGFGSVTGATETLVADGTFAKDFYAGALANYAKTSAATHTGDVSLTIEGGTFSGNIYGAASVKAGGATGTVHSVGDVNITVKGGATTKGTQACLFAGGYATGSVLSDTAVYTVDRVTATISGGSWGTAAGGRGIFGGVFASGVKAEAGDVAISISGGTMGNVYGGGWAQKKGNSTVGNVAISISGGTVANIFGGGSHSTSGGTTEAGDVTITVSGGDISGAIYARGQLDGDTVANSTVIFTGAKDFSCGVYGYSYVGATEESNATLTFAGYTGKFAGALGGFDSIEFNDGTAMTLATAAADVANSAWKFDVAARDTALADTAFLTWSDADFSGDTIALNLTTGQSAEWTLVDAAATTVYNKFDVLVDGVSQGTLALGEQLADGDFAGWGFTLDEDYALKFKNLA